MMPFTLNTLRLMRDYNGRHSFGASRALPTDTERPTSRTPASEGLSYETDWLFLTGCIHVEVFRIQLRKKFYTYNEILKKINTKISIRSVDSWKMPIMCAINHLLRCLNLSCTLVRTATHCDASFSRACRRKTLMIIKC